MIRRTLLKHAALAAAAPALGRSPSVGAGGRGNAIVAENQRPGTSDWQLTFVRHQDLRSEAIEGYCARTSVRPGETIDIFVSATPATEVFIDVFRMGFYGGKGGRHVTRLGPFNVSPQAVPPIGRGRLRDCDWTRTTRLQIPSEWLSGVYLGKLSCRAHRYQSYVIFVVRDDRRADLLFQTSDLTWQAYNKWPDNYSLHESEPPGRPVGHDEFWTLEMYDHVFAAVKQGLNAASLCGNSVHWVTALSPSEVAGGPQRIMQRTGRFGGLPPEYVRTVKYSGTEPWTRHGPSEAALIGARTMTPVNGAGSWRVTQARHWLLEGTGLQNGDEIRASSAGNITADRPIFQVSKSSPKARRSRRAANSPTTPPRSIPAPTAIGSSTPRRSTGHSASLARPAKSCRSLISRARTARMNACSASPQISFAAAASSLAPKPTTPSPMPWSSRRTRPTPFAAITLVPGGRAIVASAAKPASWHGKPLMNSLPLGVNRTP